LSRKHLVALLAAFVLTTLPVLAQEVSAGITGKVTDPSGGAIANASVTAKDLDRGTDWPTKTNQDGIYFFPRVPVGNYELRVEAPGFKTFVYPSLTLELNQRARVDAAMEIGNVSDKVTVTAEAPQLQTDTTQVGSVINSKTITETPLISRNPVALTLLTAGVTTPDPSSFNSGQRTTGGGRPYVNGNREESNNFLLDGVDNNFTSDNLVSYQPNPDAIEEFKLITNNASAEFGNFQGGIINVVIKSGTNAFHGDAFEFFRNDKLNANNWGRNWSIQSNGQSLPRTALRWNQVGGTIGGPIIKDKLFFFADYQALRQSVPPAITTGSVMPLAWRSGDFSSLLNPATQTTPGVPLNKSIQLYNPYALSGSTRSPFANNVIPPSLLNSAAVKLLNNTAVYPAPVQNTIQNNVLYASGSQLLSDQGDLKLDWRPDDKDYFSSRLSKGRQDAPGFNTLPFLYNSFNTSPFQNAVVNWTRTITPSIVNELRIGVNNTLLENGGADKGLGNIAADAGIMNAGPGLLSITGFNFATALGNANIGTQQLFANTTFHYADNVSITKGRHAMKMGGQALREWINVFYAGNNGRSGFIDFSGRFTAANATSPTGTLIGEADFMLGLPDQMGRGLQNGTWGQRSTIWGFYFQDDWRVTNRLTLNLGLRWEYHTPWVEVVNRQSNFDEFTGQLQLAGMNGNSRALYNPYKKDFQPRVGFAYTPDMLHDRLVFRGAYTISSYLEGTGTNLRLPLNPPFGVEYGALYNTPAYTLPPTTLDQGLSALIQKDPYAGATLRIWDPLVRPAQVQQWNVSLDYELPGNNVLTAGYVGQHGTHLMVPMSYNQKILVNGVAQPGPFLAGNPAVKNAISVVSGTASVGNQRYDALQATLHRRFTKGLEYQMAFTYSRGMSDAIGYYGQGGQAGSQSAYWQNLYNQRSEWGPTYFDNKFVFVPSFVYELPVGKGRKWGANMNKFANGVIGGWQLGGIFTAHTGFPLTIKMSGDPSGTGARSFRANVIGTPNDPHQIGPGALWLDPSAYSQPTSGTFGNAGVGIVRGPGMARMDLSISKNFNISEKRYIQIRAEAFNLANTPIFLSPASQTITSSLFGQIRSSEGERNVQIVGKFYF
jgi:hypothetical protein